VFIHLIMITRRKFSSLFGLSVLSSSFLNPACARKPTQIKGDLVVSTWNNQVANKLSVSALSQNSPSLLDAVVAGIKSVELDPEDQSVGYGGRPDREGKVTLDACIMDSAGNAGAVCFVQGYKHPISIARMVMESTPHVMLSGTGAEQFAEENGFEKATLLTEKSEKEYKEWLVEKKYQPKANIERHDTIGLLVKNKEGDLAGGCSTSGMAYKMSGRVGDSPIIGAGLYVDNEVGSCTATGVGELGMKTCATFLCVELMRSGMHPQQACKQAITRIIKKCKLNDSQVGLLAMNKHGEIGAFSIIPGFVYAVTTTESSELRQAKSYFKK